MRAAYRWLRKKCHPTPLAIVLGLFMTPLGVPLDKLPVQRAASAKRPIPAKPDARTARLHRFLTRIHSPVASLSADFIQEADQNHLDWRLLPGISVVESSGGKYYRNNNIFGWGGGNTTFPSIRSGIHQVAARLGQSPIYKNRSLVGKLRLYNSEDEGYVAKVLDVMRRISPAPGLPQLAKSAEPTEWAYAN